MAWWSWLDRYRGACIIAAVTAVHVIVLGTALSVALETPLPREVEYLEIEIAELAPPEPEIEPQIEPDTELEPMIEPPAPLPEAAPASQPITQPQASPTTSTPSVLTQLEPSASSEGISPAMPAAPTNSTTSSDVATPDQIANVLRQARCQKLQNRRDDDCDRQDPFAIAQANTERNGTPQDQAPDSPFVVLSRQERLTYQVQGSTFEKLGMTGDLFVDPLVPGAHTARRIRNGQEPLWNKDMRDGFSKSD